MPNRAVSGRAPYRLVLVLCVVTSCSTYLESLFLLLVSISNDVGPSMTTVLMSNIAPAVLSTPTPAPIISATKSPDAATYALVPLPATTTDRSTPPAIPVKRESAEPRAAPAPPKAKAKRAPAAPMPTRVVSKNHDCPMFLRSESSGRAARHGRFSFRIGRQSGFGLILGAFAGFNDSPFLA